LNYERAAEFTQLGKKDDLYADLPGDLMIQVMIHQHEQRRDRLREVLEKMEEILELTEVKCRDAESGEFVDVDAE
jgi:hypothetical protein